MVGGNLIFGTSWMNFGITIKEETMTETMTIETKRQIAELERQKIELESRLEMLSYANNHLRMVEIEQEIYEIEDTIRKLMP
tara:strand:- start:165 stop:410 length:246 start_codon:yes stop_codon:yes gene_type:complete